MYTILNDNEFNNINEEKKNLDTKSINNNPDIGLNNKDFLMFYHTSFRNIGLVLSISFSLLSYSRYYRNKLNTIGNIYNLILILCSIFFIVTSIIFNYQLLAIINNIFNKNKILSYYRYINHSLYFFQFVFLLLSVTTFIRSFI